MQITLGDVLFFLLFARTKLLYKIEIVECPILFSISFALSLLLLLVSVIIFTEMSAFIFRHYLTNLCMLNQMY